MSLLRTCAVGCGLIFIFTISSLYAGEHYFSGIKWQPTAVVTPAATLGDAPSDAVVLFDGNDLSAWQGAENWQVADGAMSVGKGNIRTKDVFGDCQLHLEWSAPTPVKGKGQQRGNSGIFFHDLYEIQILDSYQNQTYLDGQAGAVYKQTPPSANVTRPPGQWNQYDIFWTAPRFTSSGQLESPAYVTLIHNGVLVHHHVKVSGQTSFAHPPFYQPHPPRGSIRLQDHGNPVRFRNIWVRHYAAPIGQQVEPPYHRVDGKKRPIGTNKRHAGQIDKPREENSETE